MFPVTLSDATAGCGAGEVVVSIASAVGWRCSSCPSEAMGCVSGDLPASHIACENDRGFLVNTGDRHSQIYIAGDLFHPIVAGSTDHSLDNFDPVDGKSPQQVSGGLENVALARRFIRRPRGNRVTLSKDD